MTARPLAATYRLQLRAEFPLDAVRAIVPYLHRLGVSHIYSSPVLASRPGSTHGYDVADPTRIDPELGDEGGRLALVRELHRHEMGWLLDIVPNHMGTGPSNPFWEDVLARGRASRWAHWFDVDWADRPQRLRGRILLPVLGDDLDAVIERGELSLVRESGAWRVKYFDNSFPVSEESLELLGSGVGDQGSEKGGALIDQDPTRSPDPSTLRAILDRQHYLLANWRRAAREINYRRFFDVNELVALRVEDPRVFAETHALVLEWVGAGEIDGLRIDHIDGLLDPLGYLERLRAEVEARAPRGESAEPFPVVVEKILSPGEHLRREWPVQGTTGYEFLDDLEAVLIDSAGFERIEAHYRRLLRIRRRRGASAPPLGFAEVALRGKLYILRGALRADIYRLARQLVPIAKRDRAAAKLPREALVEAMTQLIAALPVYRTYIDGRAPAPSLEDEAVLDAAFAGARRRGGAPPEAIDFLERTILRPIGEGGDGDAERERLRFIQRLQQTTGPATAKGVEDTALYIYVPLVSRNEVGSDPARELVDAVETLHRANGERATVWPRALITTDTHDTKRSADVRARLDVLAELPEEWAARVLRWRRLNRVHRTKVHGRLEPDANTEYLLYQSMVGVWEVQEGRGARDEGREEPGGSPLAPRPSSLVDRLTAYILKAAREAKMRTSWTDRNEEFEGAIVSF
ncbi:MAG TPA: malto-oligosyltrehalose synthase, partial [Gemmatimonadaceae bacterium]|nr:malto-oligosyltrehalose synthase [Gemmatimonadaceae bacterium]